MENFIKVGDLLLNRNHTVYAGVFGTAVRLYQRSKFTAEVECGSHELAMAYAKEIFHNFVEVNDYEFMDISKLYEAELESERKLTNETSNNIQWLCEDYQRVLYRSNKEWLANIKPQARPFLNEIQKDFDEVLAKTGIDERLFSERLLPSVVPVLELSPNEVLEYHIRLKALETMLRNLNRTYFSSWVKYDALFLNPDNILSISDESYLVDFHLEDSGVLITEHPRQLFKKRL